MLVKPFCDAFYLFQYLENRMFQLKNDGWGKVILNLQELYFLSYRQCGPFVSERYL